MCHTLIDRTLRDERVFSTRRAIDDDSAVSPKCRKFGFYRAVAYYRKYRGIRVPRYIDRVDSRVRNTLFSRSCTAFSRAKSVKQNCINGARARFRRGIRRFFRGKERNYRAVTFSSREAVPTFISGTRIIDWKHVRSIMYAPYTSVA